MAKKYSLPISLDQMADSNGETCLILKKALQEFFTGEVKDK